METLKTSPPFATNWRAKRSSSCSARPGDLELVNKLQSLTKAPLLIAAGEFSPRETAALMERCATVITSDTGPMHLAMAVNTPVVALFGLVPSSLRVPPGFGHIALEHNSEC